MTKEAALFWKHAESALEAASSNIDIDASTAANRAYYAAYYAVSALFAAEGKTFKRHSAVEAAVHRDLVNTGPVDFVTRRCIQGTTAFAQYSGL